MTIGEFIAEIETLVVNTRIGVIPQCVLDALKGTVLNAEPAGESYTLSA
jgi:hypothetical protein